ncbi:MAG: DmsC/YnfH family molybdoenzyme membrane anchor subunit, partial [Acetobacterales bacterium]
ADSSAGSTACFHAEGDRRVHPAFSVIFFTTASGAGYGMLMLLGILAAFGTVEPDLRLGLAGFGVALTLVTAGLLSSTAHLGHPERAWRAFSQWRSSWLSREGVASVATYVPAGLFALAFTFFEPDRAALAWLGLITAACALVTVICTAMIYASLKTIRAWSNGWVVPAYIVLSLETGIAWLHAVMVSVGAFWPTALGLLMLLALAAFAVKRGYWNFIDTNPSGSTPETATGVGNLGKVRLLDAPHSQSNYLMREMGYKVARKHAERLRTISTVLLAGAPIVLMALSFFAPWWAVVLCAWLAVLCVTAGALVQRWLFFAEAKHVVTLYYGAEAA